MNNNRRDFIKTAGLAAAGFSLPLLGKSNFLNSFGLLKKQGAFGIQLWTVKEDLAADVKGTLKKLAGFGYNQIESFEGANGIFWGMKNTEFKKYMDDLNMQIISAHCNNTVDFERKAAEAAEIGMKYLICPWKGAQKSIDDFKKFADEFNKSGEICKKNGIKFAYHNHDYSFKAVDGQIPQAVMMEGTDASLVDFEMDIYWVVAAKENPLDWFKKYPGRFTICHVKDQIATATGIESCVLGKGTINFSNILHEAKKYGMKHHIVEQEAFTGSNPLACAEADAAYMKTFKI